MATETKTESSVKVIVTAALITAVNDAVNAQVQAEGKFFTLANVLRSEADRQGLDRDGANKLAQAAWIAAHKLPEAEPLPMKYRPSVSKVLGIAYPAKPSAEKEVKAALAHNKGADRSTRIGVNTMLELARGNTTLKAVLAGKASKKAKSRLDETSTPQERFQNSATALLENHRVGDKNRVTAEEATSLFAKALAAYVRARK